jgi:hypothetical protein
MLFIPVNNPYMIVKEIPVVNMQITFQVNLER